MFLKASKLLMYSYFKNLLTCHEIIFIYDHVLLLSIFPYSCCLQSATARYKTLTPFKPLIFAHRTSPSFQSGCCASMWRPNAAHHQQLRRPCTCGHSFKNMASYHLQHSRTNIGLMKLPCMTQNALQVVLLGNHDVMQRGFGIKLLHTDALVCEDGLLKLHLLAQI